MLHINAIRLCGIAAVAALLTIDTAPPAVAADCSASPRAGIDWTNCRKRNLILDRSDLSGAVLDSADFTSTDLRGSTLNQTNFVKAGLGRAMLDNSSAQAANFEKAEGFRTSFVNTDLRASNFTKSEMQRADFKDAVLVASDFTKSELGRANFSGAKLSDVDFSFANLARADFRGSTAELPMEFTKSYFYRTRIEGVDLSRAVGLEQWQIDLACGDASTRLPDGLQPGADWPCVEE